MKASADARMYELRYSKEESEKRIQVVADIVEISTSLRSARQPGSTTTLRKRAYYGGSLPKDDIELEEV